MRPKIFIGSSREGLRVCRAVQSELADEFDVTVWDQDVFQLTYAALDSLLEALDSSDAGIFLLRPDDITARRGVAEATVRDNVILELGMFIGRLGRDRTFMLTPHDLPIHLPTDLLGLTIAGYDPARFERDGRAAVGPACTQIREHLARRQLRLVVEPRSRERLDHAMVRMSRDLEWLLDGEMTQRGSSTDGSGVLVHDGSAAAIIGRTSVEVTFGRIQDYRTDDTASVIALPANEYFDDECMTDTSSALGAFVQAAYPDRFDTFAQRVRQELVGLPTQRVPRAERRVEDSYGIGQAIYVRGVAPPIILVSATTERTGIGLRAEPHFLYAALEGIVKTMNANRLKYLSVPVLGSGHGGMPLRVALLFNLLALRQILTDDIGRNIRRVRVVIFRRNGVEFSDESLGDVLSHATRSPW